MSLNMTETIEKRILTKIKKAKRGTLFFTDSFVNIAPKKTVSKSLERLVKKGEIIRIANGIFTRPKNDPVLGTIKPSIDEIAKAIAKRDKSKIVPTGDYALNKLGLSTQVPMNIVFLTDGSQRKISVGNFTITFKKASPKSVSALGDISKLVIQALKVIGKKNVDAETLDKINLLLRKENIHHLEHDFRLAPEWIRDIIRPILKERKNGK
jgi:hypothetical protein